MKEFFELLFSKNAKTSISGLLMAIGLAGASIPEVPEKYHWIFGILAAVGSAGLGFTAKDASTHSTLDEVETATKEEKK